MVITGCSRNGLKVPSYGTSVYCWTRRRVRRRPGGGPVGGPGGGPGNGAGNGPGFVGPGFGGLVIFLEKFMLVSLMMDFVGIISFTHCLVPFLIFQVWAHISAFHPSCREL